MHISFENIENDLRIKVNDAVYFRPNMEYTYQFPARLYTSINTFCQSLVMHENAGRHEALLARNAVGPSASRVPHLSNPTVKSSNAGIF